MVDEKIINRIKGLLAKAESTNIEAEADVFYAKAQELMMKFAVDDAILKASGKAVKEEIVTRTIELRNWLADVQGIFLNGLANILNCRTYRSSYAENGKKKHFIVGHESDAIFVELLFASVAAQAWRSGLHEGHAGRTKVECDECSGTGKQGFNDESWECEACKGKGFRKRSSHVATKSFLDGYFARVLIRSRERYKKMEVDVGPSTALVLRDKGLAVDEWLRANISLGRAKASRRRGFDGDAYSAGHRAGEKADISGGRGHVKSAEKKQLGQ